MAPVARLRSGWTRIARRMGEVQTVVLLTLVYATVLGPLALLLRIGRARDAGGGSRRCGWRGLDACAGSGISGIGRRPLRGRRFIEAMISRVVEQALMEALEVGPMVPVLQVSEFMAEGVQQTRVPERFAGDDVDQANLDRAVLETGAVAAFRPCAFGDDRAVPQAEGLRDALGVAGQTHEELALGRRIEFLRSAGHGNRGSRRVRNTSSMFVA